MNKFIPVFTRNEVAVVNEKDIIYAKNELRTVIIKTRKKDYRYYGRLRDLEELLSDCFHSCHSNMIVNFERVVRVKDNGLTMDCGEVLLMGKNAFQSTKKRFTQYLAAKHGVKK